MNRLVAAVSFDSKEEDLDEVPDLSLSVVCQHLDLHGIEQAKVDDVDQVGDGLGLDTPSDLAFLDGPFDIIQLLLVDVLVKQEDKISYLIFDGSTFLPALDKAVEKGSAFSADTLEELAQKTGVDATGLTATVAGYNEMVKNGVDTKFGKDLTGHKAIETPKYYALKVVPAILGTMTGIKTDLDAQVMTKDGKVVSGLYAAGEVANGDFFNTVYPASGTSIQMSLTFGRVAGTNAAKNAAK